ncbi:MAG TPA: hypothetical protein VJZ68_04490 [Nitrososphaera sp.]|uniref:hypothetical protein n=1 Tax=Nitrososphaera sp. TaxID=1971748 RepID=UPI002C53E4FB|nr:hypothetical protein [Nitrososphaera sp.]
MGFGGSDGAEKKKRVVWSMIILVVVVVAAGVATMAITGYFRESDPIYQCIGDPRSQPFQVSVPVTVTEDGVPVRVSSGIGIAQDCTFPVHTLEEGVIHVAYPRSYPFTLGHFLFNWKIDLTRYDTTVYVNGQQHTDGHFLDIVLRDGDEIRVEFVSRR